MLLLVYFSDSVVTSVDLKYGCIGIRAKQKWNRRLAENKQNKKTAETIIRKPNQGIKRHLTSAVVIDGVFFCALSATKDYSEEKNTTKYLTQNWDNISMKMRVLVRYLNIRTRK